MNEFRDRGGSGLPPGLAALSWGAYEPFLGLPPEETPPFRDAPVVVLPVPYEATVSYMGGTRFGPQALLTASRYVELYDHELDFEPYRIGVHTLPELVLSGAGPETALDELRRAAAELLAADKFVIMVGGEHSLSAPPIREHAARLGGERLTVLQLDAHADLRDSYEGTPLSHACVMRRVLDEVTLVPVGIRSLTADERDLMRQRGVPAVFAHEMHGTGWVERVLQHLGDTVYVTVDVDFFDPGVMPATGTPEPGGAGWFAALDLLERVFASRRVVGCDVVELAPLPGVAAPNVLAAKLVYKLVAFYARHQAGGERSVDSGR